MVTIIMPAYNEEEIIEASVREWYNEVITRLPDSDLVVVNDCSTDDTGGVLTRLSRELSKLRVVQPERNGGHGKALLLGFKHITQDYVFQTDSDRQHIPSEFWKLWNERTHSDFVFGFRTSREDGRLRKFITGAMRVINFLIWGVWIRDANCPFKLMKKNALLAILKKIPQDAFIPMVMVSILARKMKFKVKEMPVTHLARKGGSQSLKGLVKWLRVIAVCVRQVAKLHRSWKTETTCEQKPVTVTSLDYLPNKTNARLSKHSQQ